MNSLKPGGLRCQQPGVISVFDEFAAVTVARMAIRIDTVSARDKLKPRRQPYWHRLSKGCYVGYRKMTTNGHGSWLARARDETASVQQLYKPLGEFSELADHLRFDAAAKAAQAWFDHLGRGGITHAATVSDACARYVLHLKATKSELAAQTQSRGSGTMC